MINGMMVSTETHSVRQVAEDFLRWREAQKAKQRKPKAQAAAKVSKSSEKRKAAFDMYMAGASAKDVSATLCITYANAHYYKRAFNKEYK